MRLAGRRKSEGCDVGSVAADPARRRESALSGRALRAVPPATGRTIIGDLTGRVIWGSPNLLASHSRKQQYLTQRPV
jgi:hypothetical protein